MGGHSFHGAFPNYHDPCSQSWPVAPGSCCLDLPSSEALVAPLSLGWSSPPSLMQWGWPPSHPLVRCKKDFLFQLFEQGSVLHFPACEYVILHCWGVGCMMVGLDFYKLLPPFVVSLASLAAISSITSHLTKMSAHCHDDFHSFILMFRINQFIWLARFNHIAWKSIMHSNAN